LNELWRAVESSHDVLVTHCSTYSIHGHSMALRLTSLCLPATCLQPTCLPAAAAVLLSPTPIHQPPVSIANQTPFTSPPYKLQRRTLTGGYGAHLGSTVAEGRVWGGGSTTPDLDQQQPYRLGSEIPQSYSLPGSRRVSLDVPRGFMPRNLHLSSELCDELLGVGGAGAMGRERSRISHSGL
jgi:hypothetical protein